MSEKKTDAWMPLWIGAYLADTQHLTRDEHGAYFLLMMAYWRNKGPLLDDDKRLASIVKASPKEWQSLKQTLVEFFTVAGGTWTQKRIEAELNGSKERSSKAASRAKAGAQARWKDRPGDASSMPQALLGDMQDTSLGDALHNTSHTIGIGKPAFISNPVCVGIPPHTQFSEEFRTAAKARPEVDAEVVWAKFNDHYPPEKRTLARWKTWLTNEIANRREGQSSPGVNDPDSQANIEALGVSLGQGTWAQSLVQWPVYKARVLAAKTTVEA